MQLRVTASEKMFSERIQGILTELACRSADIPVDMLPVPFNEELILDFGEEPVKDLKSKMEILKFEKSWIEMVEEEEMRQEKLAKVESMLKVMTPQITFKQEMQEELKKVVPKKVVRIRRGFLAIEKARKMWQPIHQELMAVLTNRKLETTKIERQKKILSEMLKELKIVASRDVSRRKAIMERGQTTWGEIHKEMMAVLINRNSEKIKVQRQKEIKSEMLKELRKVAFRDAERRKAVMERGKAWGEIHKELMTVLTIRNLKKKQIQKQKEIMLKMLKELKVVASRYVERRKSIMEIRQTMWRLIHEEIMKTSKPDTVMPEQEQDLFVPRKLFLFSVETFKNSPENVDNAPTLQERTNNMADKCMTSVEMMPTLPKKKTFRGRLRKFFGFK